MVETVVLPGGDLSFSVRFAGPEDGEAVVFLHGFPDGAASFDDQIERLGEVGYRCLAPTMRGYEPSSLRADGDYSLMSLAGDVVELLDEAGIDRAHVVGHDWGAAVAYLLASHHGGRCRSVACLAIPPLPRIPRALRRVPRQLLLSWYMIFFQVPWVADRALSARDWKLLRWFWPRWSPGLAAPEHVVAAFDRPGVLDAALAYYRSNATPSILLGLRSTEAMSPRPAQAPVLIVNGDRDGCMDHRLFHLAIRAEDFPHGVRHEVFDGTGHWLHLEAPDRTTALLVEWLTDGHPNAPAS